MGFYPKNIELYHQAFLHKSLLKGNKLESFESNERLEYLGDAILDSIISHYLFNKFPYQDEGYLSQLRSRIVSRQNLNGIGIKLGFNELINSKIERGSKSIYGDALEALIGAIYLDRGYSWAQKFVEDRLLFIHIDIEVVMKTETDFKSRVIEWCQKERLDFEFVFSSDDAANPDLFEALLKINYIIKGKGSAHSKKKAEQLAAQEFYKTIV